MDFNQLLSLAKRNQEKNDKKLTKPTPQVNLSAQPKKPAQTPVFCKPYVKPVKAPQPIPNQKRDVPSIKQQLSNRPKPTAPVVPKPTKNQPKSFADLLALAKNNVTNSSNSKPQPNIKKLEPREPQREKKRGIAFQQPKNLQKSSYIPPRSINDAKQMSSYNAQNGQLRPSKAPAQVRKNPPPTKNHPQESLKRGLNQQKPNRPPPKASQQPQLSGGIRSQTAPQRTIASRPIPSRPIGAGPIRSGIAAQLGNAPVCIQNSDDDYESEDYDSDFIDDSEIIDDKQYSKVVKIIQKTMNFDPEKYAKVNKYDDLKNMESSYHQLERENARSARLGAKEDRDDMQMELEKKRRKAEKL